MDTWKDRRSHDRHEVKLPLQISDGVGSFVGCSENLSYGGACLVHEPGRSFKVGSVVDVEVDLPGQPERARVQAEVRWSGRGRTGLKFRAGALAAVAAFIASLSATPAMAATTTVPEFDPSADVQLDMDAGGERPDEYTVLQAFEQQYSAFDQCVYDAKAGKDHKLPGDVDVEVLLNPKGNRPLGVNAKLSKKVKGQKALRDCLRNAVAGAHYPSYDGVPVVVQFSFELDPGMQEVVE